MNRFGSIDYESIFLNWIWEKNLKQKRKHLVGQIRSNSIASKQSNRIWMLSIYADGISTFQLERIRPEIKNRRDEL